MAAVVVIVAIAMAMAVGQMNNVTIYDVVLV